MTLNDTYVSVIGIKEADERMKKIREIYEEQSSKISNMPDRNSGLQITSGIANFKSKYFGRISDWGKRETIINALTVVCCVFDQTLFECSIQKNERTGAERIEFIDCMFKRCHFNDTLFENVTFKNCIFIDCTLGCRKWKSVRMSCCLFDDKCRFNAADLMNVDVTMTNLIDLFKFGCFESCKTDGTILSLWESGIYLPSGLELKETEAIQEDEETEEDKFDTVEVLNSTIELFSQALANSNNLFKVLIPNDYPAIERSVKTVINLLESNKVEEKYKKVNKKEFWSKIDSNRTSGEALKFNDLNLSGFDFTCHQLKTSVLRTATVQIAVLTICCSTMYLSHTQI